ncbi:Fibronectin type III domain protein [compost metagenome]
MKQLLHIPLGVVKKTCLLLMICGFATIVNAQQVSESFESPVFPPKDWKLIGSSNQYDPVWKLSNSNATHGNRKAFVENYAGGGPNSWLITHKIELTANQAVEITFDYNVTAYFAEDPSPAHLKITAGTDNTISGQSIVLETISITSTAVYTTKTVSFTALQAGIYYFGFNAYSPHHQLFGMSLDKVIVKNAVNCPNPTNLASNAVTANSATVSWNETGTATSWQVQVTKDALPKEGDWSTVTQNQYTFPNLTAGTTYTAYIRSLCPGGGYSSFSNPVTFTTSCPEAIAAPYTVAFETNNIPGCWTENGDTNWKFNTKADYAARSAGDHSVLKGYTNYAWVDGSTNTNGKSSTLTSPTVNVSGLNNPAIEFYAYSENNISALYNELKVEIYTGAAWVTVATLTTNSGGWKFYSIDLVELDIENTVQARFTVTGNGENYHNDILLDDVSFREKTTCSPANNVNASIINADNVTITWDSENTGSTLDIAYGLYDYNFDGTANLTSVSGPYVLGNLEPSTTYVFYTRTNCGNVNVSEWNGPYSFTTNCLVIVPNQYNQPFNGVYMYPYTFENPGLPKCWEMASGGDSSTGPLNYGTGSWKSNLDASYGIYTHSETVSTPVFGSDYTSWLLSPLFDLSAEEYEMKLTFALSINVNYYPNLISMGSDDEVKLLYTVDGITWQTLKTWSAENGYTSGSYSYIVPLENITGNTVRFAFWVSSGSIDDDVQYVFHADDLTIRPASICKEVLNLTADGITSNSAKLGWDNYNDISSWNVAVVAPGASPVDWTSVTTNPYKAINLLPNTTYDYYVKSVCGNATSEIISGPFTFTTRCEPIVAPYTETFVEEREKPACWLINPLPSNQIVYVIDYWNFTKEVGFDAGTAGDHTEGGGTHFVWVNLGNFSNKEKAILTTPLVDVSALEHPSLNFYVFSKNTLSPAINSVNVEVYTGEEWVLVTTINGLTNNWAPYTIDLSNYTITGPIEARFTITVNTNGGDPSYNTILIDDVAFIEMPNCPAPFNITTTEITETTAIVEWETTVDSEWELEYGPAGFTPGNGTVVTIENGIPSANLSNLTPETNYEVYIKAICDEDGELIGPGKFKTDTVLGNGEIIKDNIALYPNPVQGNLTIKSDNSIGTVIVYNIYGQKVTEQLFDTYTATIDFASFSSGIYLVKLSNGGKEQTFKIIKD